MSGFAHDVTTGITTLSEILRVQAAISADRFFGCFAYATQSGFRAFELGVTKNFWNKTESRWLIGIDYGRTDPRALREIAKRANTEVRVYDGRFVVEQDGFIPRRDFHPKVAMMENTTADMSGAVLGSGNFSYNGLQRSIEAGSAFICTTSSESDSLLLPVKLIFEGFWNHATPLDEIIGKYETRLAALVKSKDSNRPTVAKSPIKAFWIEAGYVTKNRGSRKPGNQIFAPNGFRKYFRIEKGNGKSTLIGRITFESSVGPTVTNNYRENDNGMEKLTLPFPEEHGFGVYDGKVLVFEERGKSFLLSAIEAKEFELTYGHRLANVREMNKGRRFGELV